MAPASLLSLLLALCLCLLARGQIPLCASQGGLGTCTSDACIGMAVSSGTNCSVGQSCCVVDWGSCTTSSGINGSCTVSNACAGSIVAGSCSGAPASVGCCVPNATEYLNPVIPGINLPDPGALFNPADGLYYATMTTNWNFDPNKFPIFSSKDLATWTHVGYIFPNNHTPVWAVQDFWAPEIHIIEGRYVAYYAARNAAGMLSIGVAISGSITGPYVDVLGEPLVTNSSVGNIDATHAVDQVSGQAYLVWKEDGNDPAHYEPYTPIWAQAIDPFGAVLSGPKHLLLENNRSSWEGGLVEAPWIINIGAYYYLFYSANVYDTTFYAIGVARSSALLGPYEKNPANPIVQSNSRFAGPGHCSALAIGANGPYVLLYHSWLASAIGGLADRVLMLDTFTIDANGWPVLQGASPSFLPTDIPQIGRAHV